MADPSNSNRDRLVRILFTNPAVEDNQSLPSPHLSITFTILSTVYTTESIDYLFHDYWEEKCFQVPYSLLDYDAISSLISSMNIPFVIDEEDIIARILDQAYRVRSRPSNAGRKLIPIGILVENCIALRQLQFEARETEEGLTELQEAERSTKPTKRPWMNAVETIKMDSRDSVNTCSICLEKATDGSEAARLPCSHTFHRNCIRRWLDRQPDCPLCRFKLPTSDT